MLNAIWNRPPCVNEVKYKLTQQCTVHKQECRCNSGSKFLKNEPYRVILGDVRDKLYNTREHSRHLLSSGISEIPEEATFTNVEQVLSDTIKRGTLSKNRKDCLDLTNIKAEGQPRGLGRFSDSPRRGPLAEAFSPRPSRRGSPSGRLSHPFNAPECICYVSHDRQGTSTGAMGQLSNLLFTIPY